MTRDCQVENSGIPRRARDLPQHAESYDVMTQQGLYSGGVAKIRSRTERRGGRELWDGERIKEIRDARGLTRPELADRAKMSVDDLGRHERNDAESNPSVDVLMRIALALSVRPGAILEPKGSPIPRPDQESGVGQRPEGDPLLAAFAHRLAELDTETPAEDSWRGDVLKAIAVLNRALRRESDAGTAPPTAKVGR